MADRAPLSTLSSLLAAHGVPTRSIEEAISRQVVHGSDLATNLLEVGGVNEELLLKVLTEASGLPPAPLGSLAPSMHTALALVSADVAHQQNILPFTLTGTTLILVVAEPLVSPEQLGFGSKITVQQQIAPLPRIRQAISKAYRIPLERRFTRLLGKMGEPSASSSRFDIQDEPTQVSGIPLIDLGIVRPATQTPATLAAGGSPATIQTPLPAATPAAPPAAAQAPAKPSPLPAVVSAKPSPFPAAAPAKPAPAPLTGSDHDAPITAPPGGLAKSFNESAVPQTIPGDVALAKGNAPAWAARAPIVQVVEPPAGWRPLTSDDMPETIPAPRLAAMGVKPGGAPLSAPMPPTAAAATTPAAKDAENKDDDAAPVSRRTAGLAKRETARGRAAGGLFRRTVVGEHKARETQARQVAPEPPPQDRRGSVRVRRKGPFTAPQAEEELAEAATTDVVLDILFAFVQQFFEYSVLFVVSGEMADGRDASGPGLTATQIKNVKIPLDQPSILQLARDRKAPVTAPPVAHGVDVQIIRDLAREARFADGYRATVAVLPIVVRNRVVALLFGDDGHVDVDLSALGDVIIILGRTVEALERIILRKKLGAAGRSPSVFPPGTPTSDAPPPPIEGLRPVGLAALARALDASIDSEGTHEPDVSSLPPTKSAPQATLLSAAALRSTENPGFTVRHEQPDVIPRSSRQAARAGGTNRGDSTSSSSEPAGDEDVPDPAAPSERSGPGSRRRRFLNGPNSRPRLAPVSSRSPESTLEVPQPTIQGMPRSQRRGTVSVGRPRTVVGPRPLPANLGAAAKSPVRVPPGRTIGLDNLPPETLAGPPLPPTVQARRLVGTTNQLSSDKVDPALQQAEREIVALLQRFVESNGADDDAGQAIVQMGERAVSAIMARFPGPLAAGVERDQPGLPPPSSCGPLLALLVAIGNDAVLQVAQRATSIISEDRFWAAHVLSEIPSVESAEIVGTMLFDDDLSVRRCARRATVQLVAAVPDAAGVIAAMLEQAIRGPSERPGRRFIALEALGELAIPSTIPALITLLGDSVQDVGDAVHRALVQITCQDFGRDARRWNEWFGANAGRHRVEWIIDALMHDSVEMRRIAADALIPVARGDFRYDPYESREERASAHVRYLLWWEREGHIQFAQ